MKLNKIHNMLLSILVTSVAYFRLYMEQIGVAPLYLAGHSLGEYSALICSEVISFKDGIEIVKARCDIAQEVLTKDRGMMTIIKNIDPEVAYDECVKLCQEGSIVNIACYNSPNQILISGSDAGVIEAEKRLLNCFDGANIIPLIGAAPYHSKLMESKADQFQEILSAYPFGQFKWPVISNISGRSYRSVQEVTENLVKQLYQPVLWSETIQTLVNNDVTIAIEIGPQNVLKNLITENTTQLKAFSFDEKQDRQAIADLLKKHRITQSPDCKAEGRMAAVRMCLAHAASSRNCNADNTSVNSKIVNLYNKINDLNREIEETPQSITDDNVINAFSMLDTILTLKATPDIERTKRFDKIIDKTNSRSLYDQFLSSRSQNESQR